jgi:hypothetical protein
VNREDLTLPTPQLHAADAPEVSVCTGCGALYRPDDVAGECPLCARPADGWDDPRWGDPESRMVAALVLATLVNLLIVAIVVAATN